MLAEATPARERTDLGEGDGVGEEGCKEGANARFEALEDGGRLVERLDQVLRSR